MHNPFATEQLLVLDIATYKSKMATALEGRQLHNHTITEVDRSGSLLAESW